MFISIVIMKYTYSTKFAKTHLAFVAKEIFETVKQIYIYLTFQINFTRPI